METESQNLCSSSESLLPDPLTGAAHPGTRVFVIWGLQGTVTTLPSKTPRASCSGWEGSWNAHQPHTCPSLPGPPKACSPMPRLLHCSVLLVNCASQGVEATCLPQSLRSPGTGAMSGTVKAHCQLSPSALFPVSLNTVSGQPLPALRTCGALLWVITRNPPSLREREAWMVIICDLY